MTVEEFQAKYSKELGITDAPQAPAPSPAASGQKAVRQVKATQAKAAAGDAPADESPVVPPSAPATAPPPVGGMGDVRRFEGATPVDPVPHDPVAASLASAPGDASAYTLDLLKKALAGGKKMLSDSPLGTPTPNYRPSL